MTASMCYSMENTSCHCTCTLLVVSKHVERTENLDKCSDNLGSDVLLDYYVNAQHCGCEHELVHKHCVR